VLLSTVCAKRIFPSALRGPCWCNDIRGPTVIVRTRIRLSFVEILSIIAVIMPAIHLMPPIPRARYDGT
jgi:hypothetical protein